MVQERGRTVHQGGRESSHIKGTLHDRKVVRTEKVGKINQDLIGKREEGPREEEMYRIEVKHIGKETFHNRKEEKACKRD